MKAANSRCENCSSLIACCSCGVIANVWREARMRLGPIRMCPHPWRSLDLPQERYARTMPNCRGSAMEAALMLENIDLRPAGQVQTGAAGQKAEGGLGQFGP